jgi:hypothetical protein
MARDLDTLIREAKPQEAPSAADREQVRRAIEQRLTSGDVPRAPATSLSLTSIAIPVLGALCVIGAALALWPEGGARRQAPGSSAPADEVAPLPRPFFQPQPEAQPQPQPQPLPQAQAQARPHPPSAPRIYRPDRSLQLSAEARALAHAQRALRDSAPTRALTLLDEQDREFASGLLSEERAAARVIALCAAGRVAEARQNASAFTQRYPASPLRARVLAACAEPK